MIDAVVFRVGNGFFHGDDLLGLLWFLDVVGPQGDIHTAVKGQSGRRGAVDSQEMQLRFVKNSWQLGGCEEGATEGGIQGMRKPGVEFSVSSASQQ